MGPARWISSHAESIADVIPVVYHPVLYVVDGAPMRVGG
jgi:hypothetical protein